MEGTLKDIIVVIAELDSADQIQHDSHLLDDLGLDSLMMIDLGIDVNDRLGVKIQPKEQAKLQTFGDLVTLVSSLKA